MGCLNAVDSGTTADQKEPKKGGLSARLRIYYVAAIVGLHDCNAQLWQEAIELLQVPVGVGEAAEMLGGKLRGDRIWHLEAAVG